MKTYALTIIISFLICCNCSAEIKNGYEVEIAVARQSLKNLHALLITEMNLSLTKKKEIKNQIKKIEQLITNYESTTRLLGEFREISPELYDEINFITDHEGRPVDVYVKFMNREQLPQPLKATSNVEHDKRDKHAYYSEYGFNTVSIKVAIEEKALSFLAHEFGHIRYLVPNLATYIKHYLSFYKDIMDWNQIGHHPDDPSGQMAKIYEKRFGSHYNAFLKLNGLKKITRRSS